MKPSNLRSVTLSLLVFFIFVSSASAKKQVFRLSDFGITPTSTDSLTVLRLQKALDEIKSKAQTGAEIIVRFERGTYHFHANFAPGYELYVSNHDQNQPKRVGIYLDGWENLTLDGNGSEFVFHGRMLPLALRHSTNTKLANFSIDFEHPHISQAEILENSEEGIRFRVPDGFNYHINAAGYYEIFGENWSHVPSAGIAFEGDTRHIVYNTSDIAINTAGAKILDDGTVLAPAWKDKRLCVGTRVAMRTWHRPCPGIFLDENISTDLADVTIHYAEGMGLIAQRCDGIHLKKFNICLRGDDDPRYFTTQADATHFSQCRGLILSENGLYEGMMDDAINIHGIYLSVRERIDEHTLRCRFMEGQAWGFNWGDAGDTVQFVSAQTMDYLPGKYVIESISPADKSEVKGCREFNITFTTPLAAEIAGDGRVGIEDLAWTPQVIFRNNVVRNNRARGALFSSPRRTICENNLFDHTSGTAILLCGDCNGWYESGSCRDLTIRKNTFVNALTNMFQFTNAVISIYPEIPNLSGQTSYFHGGSPRAIKIEKNTFNTFDAPLLYVKSVDGITFKNNKIRKNTDFKPFHWNKHQILVEHSKNMDFDIEAFEAK